MIEEYYVLILKIIALIVTIQKIQKTKIDPFGKHGYGLNNVRRVVKKYHGNLAISCLDGFFTTRIILYIED